MENNVRPISKEAIFETEDKAFTEGGFRMAHKAKSDDESLRGNTWIVKKYNASSKETFERWEKPVNHNHENVCIVAIIVSNPLPILIWSGNVLDS